MNTLKIEYRDGYELYYCDNCGEYIDERYVDLYISGKYYKCMHCNEYIIIDF